MCKPILILQFTESENGKPDKKIKVYKLTSQ